MIRPLIIRLLSVHPSVHLSLLHPSPSLSAIMTQALSEKLRVPLCALLRRGLSAEEDQAMRDAVADRLRKSQLSNNTRCTFIMVGLASLQLRFQPRMLARDK